MYLIINIITGMIYVGVTLQDINHRFWEHKSDARNNKLDHGAPRLEEAICEYGESNFVLISWESGIPKDQMFARENFWIRILNTRDPTIGYNGQGGSEFPTDSREYNHAKCAKWYYAHRDEILAHRRAKRAVDKAVRLEAEGYQRSVV